MTYVDVVTSIVGIVASVFGLYKAYDAHIHLRKPRLREEFQFAKKFVQAIQTDPKMHPYLVEKGFFAVSGDPFLSAAEIRYLLSLASPSTAIRRYLTGREHLDFSLVQLEGKKRIDFKHSMQSSRVRSGWKWFYATVYVVTATLAFTPLFVAHHLLNNNWQIGAGVILICLVTFGWVAITMLQTVGKIWRAEELVLQQ